LTTDFFNNFLTIAKNNYSDNSTMVHVLQPTENKGSKFEDYPILQEFKDVFPDEIPG